MKFPQYRKYKNDLSFFKIESPDVFTEWKSLGIHWEKNHFKAEILPDRNYIADMLFNYEPYWDKITEKEFEEFLNSIA